ncbi:glycosyltransferase [Nakamurella sp.]|uniref:glycosyltransferase n=1 Tax=Nakamurella sp. TaxID=1869182 RepID=UPI003783E5C4
MRLLVSFVGGTGHFLPLAPPARAAAAAGDRVLVTGQSAMLPVVAAAGFTVVDSGGRTLADPAARRPLAPVDRAAEAAVINDVFAGRIARGRATRLIEIGRTWRPDVILHDEVDFGAAIAADVLGLPRVELVVLPAGGTVDRDRLASSVARTSAEFGLPAGPRAATLTLEPAPPGFRDPTDPLIGTVRRIRPAALDVPLGDPDPATARVLGRLDQFPDRPVVWLTLGTIFHQESGDLFGRMTAGLSRLDASVMVTVGRELDPAELGPTPPNVWVERYVPQQFLLPRCDLVACHAGSGSVLGALAFGVPMLLVPMGADQPANADRCAALGVATVLDPLRLTPEQVARAARTALQDPRFRAAAQPWRAACAALPTAADAVPWIHQLSRHSSGL